MQDSRHAQRRSVDIFLVGVCLLWSLWAGKDLNWDLRNYHFYLPFSLLEGRLDKDFFPASIQSYLNPISYVPFYWMVSAGWNSFAVSLVLAAAHSLNLLLIWRITRLIFEGFWLQLLVLVLGILAPIFWVEVGTSFNDSLTSILVLGGVYSILASPAISGKYSYRLLLLGGGLFGAATALKLTNAPFAVAAVALLFRCDTRVGGVLRAVAVLAAGGLIGYGVFGGYWSFLLWQEYGNPFFPFFNNLFCSPDFPCSGIKAARFGLSSITSAVFLPFEMASPVAWVYTETVSPDIRFAVLIAAIMALLIWGVLKSLIKPWRPRTSAALPDVARRILGYLLVSSLLWMLTSANGRYAIPMELLVGVAIACAVQFCARKYQVLILVTICAVQFLQLCVTSDSRWAAAEWRQSWFEEKIPQSLRERPYLFFSVGQQSNAFVIPWLNPNSRHVNFIGQYSLSLDGPGGKRLKRLMMDFSGDMRMLATVTKGVLDGRRPNESYIRELNVQFSTVGLAVSPTDCVFIESQAAAAMGEGGPYTIMSCPLVDAPLRTWTAEEERALKVMDVIESHCHLLLNPAGVATERNVKGLRRYYVGTEIKLYVSSVGQVYMSKIRVPNDFDLGRLEDWEGKRAPVSCPRHTRSSPWFTLPEGNPGTF